MRTFNIGDKVKYKGREAIIADHLNGSYALWNYTGKTELKINGKDVGWVPGEQLTKGWR